MSHVHPAACTHRSEYARSEMGDGSAVGGPGAADEPGPEYDLLPDLPPSWVPKLGVSRDMMDMRCPRVRVCTDKSMPMASQCCMSATGCMAGSGCSEGKT